MRWSTVEEFYEQDTRRAEAREVDFGHRWQAYRRWPEWRLTWLADTGEIILVAANLGPDPEEAASPMLQGPPAAVVLAGWAADEAQLRKALKGWEREQHRTAGIQWILDRVRRHLTRDMAVTEQHRRRAHEREHGGQPAGQAGLF